VVGIAYFIFLKGGKEDQTELWVRPTVGDFVISITTSGELEAKNSVKILGPNGLRAANLWNVKIEDLVDEGTVVKEGDYIASLDKSELSSKINDAQLELDKANSQYTQTKLDTALQLREARDKLVNLKYDKEEKALVLEQSKFEPPATIKQAEISVEKAKRAHQQATSNYEIQKAQSIAKMQESTASLNKAKSDLRTMTELLKEFEIKAPEEGMVIYARQWNGRRKEAGSTISPWDQTVATLPDLSKMISRTYVNEVDIRKLKEGQKVKIGLDAYPEKKLTGKVIKVANVGEQKGNTDAKVFEVTIEVNESDTTLRPAMTTANTIIADVIKEVTFVPLECVHNQGDTLTYVLKKDGLKTVKQEVRIGKTNSDEVIISDGIEPDDKLYLSLPSGKEDFPLRVLEGSVKSND
ncbi:efflux RND transporter periplasmic adaptor subunit, partial [Xanthovirga aplysinae]|uniref:efflux RND transporter periplasmic adaptor subunit n=1 Tax=Xanthovirga aplysinae TaxID=2529853 RepID=UPI0012BCF164